MIQSSCALRDDAEPSLLDGGLSAPVSRAPRTGAREKALNLLRRCFSEEEWIWLLQELSFQSALDEVRNIDQAEPIIKQGLRLIHLARKGKLPSGRQPPPVSRVWH